MNNTAVKDVLGMEEGGLFERVTMGIATPETVRSWSRGEVKNPETINYRSFKPEKGGLFCERIFGPTKDWECNCGKYKRVKHKGVVCDRCGVEVTQSRVRRQRMGHLELAVPISHVWFFKCMPSRMSLMLDMTVRELERVLYYEDWLVTDSGDTPLEERTLLSDEDYREAREAYGDSFEAGMGAEYVQKLLGKINLEELQAELKQKMENTKSKAERKKIAKRLRIVEGFLSNQMSPEHMVMSALPVIPPDLRPLVPLEGGRFATSDLNDLYRRVINRNNRLKNLLQLHTPEVIIRNEKRMLQESVDALLDNGRQGRPVTGTGNRPLKSLSDMLKGKQGRFRQNLLGKRVDYSGRSVIVVGPELRLNQCGIPKKMAMVLFEPFIIRQLKERGYVHTVRSAKKMIERQEPVVWDILEDVIEGHPVLLNRAPTLHRLSIQAFDPVLVEGQAIQLHPLACQAYNADFDGDQMAVHIPLSNQAQMEAKLLMMAPNNIYSPADGKPIATPSQDITLGAYYLTYEKRSSKKSENDEKIKSFINFNEVFAALHADAVDIHEPIWVSNPDYQRENNVWGNTEDKLIKTTPGRCIFNDIWPDEMGFFNKVADKKLTGQMIHECFEYLGQEKTINLLDELKNLAYEYATKAGFSMSMADMIIPENKSGRLEEAHKEVWDVRKQREQGVITDMERYNKCVDIWTQANNDLASALFHTLEKNEGKSEINPVYAMLDSGARGSRDQIRQLAGMRGLMAKPSGEIIERPILANFREGLSVLEYFLSSHGARKGLADTALKTADSGYLTRKLVDVAQDVVCTEEDCNTVNGIFVTAIREGDEDMASLQDRITGRYSVDDIHDPLSDGSNSLIVSANQLITPEIADQIADLGIERVHIRSVLTCESSRGICAKCYGTNPATGEMPREGDAMGIMAAQSIGEPGTQLTMRTFHYGGTASATFKQPVVKAKKGGTLRFEEVRSVEQQDGNLVVLNRNGLAVLEDEDGLELERFELIPGAVVSRKEGDKVEPGETFARWDPYNVPIICEMGGRIGYRDLIEGVTLKRELSEASGKEEVTVMEHREDLHPQLVILDEEDNIIDHKSLPAGAHIMVEENVTVQPGETVARTPRQSVRTTDITGGLPRVAELFEARRPKEAAEIARIDGVVELGKISKGKRNVTIRDLEDESQTEEHSVPANKRLVVFDGDFVNKGQPLTDGAIVPHELLEVCGPQELQKYLVNQVQEVYRLQGVEINDKHIEIIARQMMRKVRITEAGSTHFLYGDTVDQVRFREENSRVIAEGGQPAQAQPVLLGITKASLQTESFISAASFQDTTRILTEAATSGATDHLRGFKENVIMGNLIPAGTGYRKIAAVQVEAQESAEEETEEEGEGPASKSDEARAVLDL